MKICKGCGEPVGKHPAISRYGHGNICSDCGTREALSGDFISRLDRYSITYQIIGLEPRTDLIYALSLQLALASLRQRLFNHYLNIGTDHNEASHLVEIMAVIKFNKV